MAKDQDPLEGEAPDPTESDTPEDETEDTAEDEASTQVDWETRYKELHKRFGVQSRELGILRRGATQVESDEESDEGDDDAGDDDADLPDYLDDQNARLAAQVFGDEAVEAATSVWPLLERAQTTADWMQVLESYHEARSKGASASEAAEAAGGTRGTTRQQAVQPRVDSNRSEGPDSSTKSLEEARKSGSLGSFASAAIEAMGLGGGAKK